MNTKKAERRFRTYKAKVIYEQEAAIIDFTEQVVEAMNARGMKRSELADKLKVTKSAVTQMLQGATNFSLKTAVAVAMAMGKRLRVRLEDIADPSEYRPIPAGEPLVSGAADGAVVLRPWLASWSRDLKPAAPAECPHEEAIAS